MVALNKSDLIRKQGTVIDVEKLSRKLGCPVINTVSIQAEGLKDVIKTALEHSNNVQKPSYIQEEIDLANVQLLEAINQLELINNENGAQVISLVVLTSGGALTLGTALFLAIRRWRLW